MSVKVMGAVWDLKIGRDEKLVLLAYADHADHNGFSIYPAVSTIAEKTGYSERSVQLITRNLEKTGYLIADGTGIHGTNKWHIPIYRGEIMGGAETAPVQNIEMGGAENDTEGCKKTPKGVQNVAPEPLLTVIKPIERESSKKEIFSNSPIDWQIATGLSSKDIDSLNEKERHSKEITDLYEKVMGYSPLNWSGRLDRLRKFLLTKMPDEIKTFAAWSRKEFSTFTPSKARQFPDMVIDLWPQAFLIKDKKSVEDRVNAFLERR